jgi:hypothetical protein
VKKQELTFLNHIGVIVGPTKIKELEKSARETSFDAAKELAADPNEV